MRARHLVLCVAAFSVVATSSTAATIEIVTQFSPLALTSSGGCNFETGTCAQEYEYRSRDVYPPELGLIYVPQFDPILGDLESVEFVLSVQVSAVTRHSLTHGYTETELSSENDVANFAFGFGVTLVDPPLGLRIGDGGQQTQQIVCVHCNLSWNDGFTVSEVTTEDLAQFVGADSIAFEYNGGISAWGYGTDWVNFGILPPELRTIYTYTAPEPGTGLLLGLGLVMAVRARRRM